MRTYRFRIYPSDAQITILNSTLELCRELYNSFLEQRILAHRMGKSINYNYQQNQIPELKNAFKEYGSIHSQVLQDIARRVDRAYDNFFRRIREKKNGKNMKAGFPRFKPSNRYNSITYTQSGFRIMENGHVFLSRIGKIRMFMHRPVTGEIKTLSVKRDSAGDWFVTFTVRTDMKPDENDSGRTMRNHQSEPVNPVGIDLGLKALFTTSDGKQTEPPEFLRKSEKKLRKAQRNLSGKKTGSGKRKKAKRRVAKIHRKIERQRDDFSHKLSNTLVKEHDLIVFEDLNIRGMIRNHHLAKSISDAGWNRIVRYTMYRAESAGTSVVLIDPEYTSRECSRCGNMKRDLDLPDRIYHCDVCGLTMDRDLNAAINIRRKGVEKLEELRCVGRGTPEVTPVETGDLPMATQVAETGSSVR